jgi:hypothetical protein
VDPDPEAHRMRIRIQIRIQNTGYWLLHRINIRFVLFRFGNWIIVNLRRLASMNYIGSWQSHFFSSCQIYSFWGKKKTCHIMYLRQCCGSESERIRKFWLNPNPKKKFGFGSRHCCRVKICVKNRRSDTWKRKNLCFS